MIRQFQPGDASSCCALIRACLASDSSYSSALLQRIRTSETPQSMNERAKLFYIAVYESENRLLGVVGLDMNEIRLLYVSPEHQRRGIGRFLLEHIKIMVPSALFSDIFVYSSEQAVGFYRACGFMDKGPFVIDLEGEPLPTVFLTLPTL
jgi:N-acetylglutamate synthase-like GNAT family acetyltransferase